MTGTTQYDVLDAVACRIAGACGWRFDPGLRRFTLSPRAAAVLSLEGTASVGFDRFLGCFARPGREILAAELDRVASAGARFDLLLEPAERRGPELLVAGEAQQGAGAGPHHVIGALQEIPARRNPVRKPEDRVTEFRHLAALLPEIVFTATPDGTIDFVNHTFEDVIAGAAESEPWRPWKEGAHPEDWEAAWEGFRRAIAEGMPFRHVLRARPGPEAPWRRYRLHAAPLRAQDGTVLRWIGQATDIEGPETVEAAQRHLNERLQLALDAAGMGVWERAVDSVDYGCDARLRDMYDLAPGENWTRELLLDRMHDEDRPRFLAAVTAADDAGRPSTIDFRVVGPAGEVLHHRTHSIVQTGADGRRRVVGVVQDVTRDARLREEIERRRREAEAATEAKSQFLAVVSHEIRTPLNGVLGMASLLETTALGSEQQSMLSVIRGSGELLMTVLNDILDFSKIESGQIDIERLPFSLADTVLHSAALNRPKADSSGIGFFVSFEGDVRRPRLGDAHRIGQILNNLVGNALKFTRDGSVTFAVRADETDRVTIEVTDTGIGMSPDQAARVFHPFTQADPSITRRYGGTGLGLTIAERLARAMGGDIAIESRLGTGTTMRVTLALPLAPEPPPEAG